MAEPVSTAEDSSKALRMPPTQPAASRYASGSPVVQLEAQARPSQFLSGLAWRLHSAHLQKQPATSQVTSDDG